MTRIVACGVAVAVLVVAWTPASAQIPVFDLANNIQYGLTYVTLEEQLRKFKEITQTMLALAAKLVGMDRFRTPPIVASKPDATNLPWAKPIIDGLTLGDPRDERYRAFVTPLPPLQPFFDMVPLSPQARRAIEAAYGGLQVYDTVIPRAVHQSALHRGFTALAAALKALDDDVGSPDNKTHYLTAELGKVAGGLLILNRQVTNDAQQTSGQLEQAIAHNIARRNDQAQAVNFALDVAAAQASAAAAGDWAGDALWNWSLR